MVNSTQDIIILNWIDWGRALDCLTNTGMFGGLNCEWG